MPVTFDAANQTYTVNGKTVAPKAVRRIVEADLDLSRERMQDIGRRFQDGDLTTLQFRKQMQAELSSLHVAHSAAGYGGWENMTPQRWGATGQKIGVQNKYLEGLIKAAGDKDYLASPGFLSRLGRYSDAALGSYEAARNAACQDAGFVAERSELGSDEHNCDVCVEEAAKGWSPIGTLIPIGQRQCLNNCRCEMSYQGT